MLAPHTPCVFTNAAKPFALFHGLTSIRLRRRVLADDGTPTPAAAKPPAPQLAVVPYKAPPNPVQGFLPQKGYLQRKLPSSPQLGCGLLSPPVGQEGRRSGAGIFLPTFLRGSPRRPQKHVPFQIFLSLRHQGLQIFWLTQLC